MPAGHPHPDVLTGPFRPGSNTAPSPLSVARRRFRPGYPGLLQTVKRLQVSYLTTGASGRRRQHMQKTSASCAGGESPLSCFLAGQSIRALQSPCKLVLAYSDMPCPVEGQPGTVSAGCDLSAKGHPAEANGVLRNGVLVNRWERAVNWRSRPRKRQGPTFQNEGSEGS